MTKDEWKLREEILGGRDEILSSIMDTYTYMIRSFPLFSDEVKNLAAKAMIVGQLSPETFGKVNAFVMLNSLKGFSLFSMLGLYEKDEKIIRSTFIRLSQSIEKTFGYTRCECIYYFVEYANLVIKIMDELYPNVSDIPEKWDLFLNSMNRVIHAIGNK